MTGLEYSQDAINAAKELNPQVQVIQGDMSVWHEPNSYDFIYSRGVYIFCRVNAFSDQIKVIKNCIDSLKSGGVFVLVCDDAAEPECMEFDKILKHIAKDKQVRVYGRYYEAIFTKCHRFLHGKLSYHILKFLLMPFFIYRKLKGTPTMWMMAFRKK